MTLTTYAPLSLRWSLKLSHLFAKSKDGEGDDDDDDDDDDDKKPKSKTKGDDEPWKKVLGAINELTKTLKPQGEPNPKAADIPLPKTPEPKQGGQDDNLPPKQEEKKAKSIWDYLF